MSDYSYPGAELCLFRSAVRWKSYWFSRISKFVRGDVLEVGAGNGNNTHFILPQVTPRSWTCIEPDLLLFRQLSEFGVVPRSYPLKVVNGTVEQIDQSEQFDSILYLDVLEHIEDDKAELDKVVAYLRPSGYLIVLAPALPYLFSRFDEAVGHHRRYTKDTLRELCPTGCRLLQVEYLDSCGVIASLVNRYFLARSLPSHNQVQTWDRLVVPTSIVIDNGSSPIVS